MAFQSTKIIELGSCAFRQPTAQSHCKYLHGYRLTAKFWFVAKHLDENNWVVDFGGLKGLKKVLKAQFDHTTCVSLSDPKIDVFKQMRDAGLCDLRLMDGVGIEKFSEWCFKTANSYIAGATNNRCRCVRVELFEHENNSVIYTDRSSVDSGRTYMEDKADEIEISEEEDIKVDITKPVSNKKEANITRPPFKPSQKKKVQPLFPEKQTNKWINPEGTWGL